MEDIHQMNASLGNYRIHVYDRVRFFKEDIPASQFEAGQQKGGHFFILPAELKQIQ